MLPVFKSFFLTFSLFIVLNANAQDPKASVNSADLISKGTDLYNKGKYKEAIAEYLKVSRNDTNYITVLHDLAFVYYVDSNFLASNRAATLGLKYYPEKADDWYNLIANNLDKMGKQKEAIAYYDSIIKNYQNAYLPWFNKGITYYAGKQMAEAKTALQQAVLINPYYSPAHYQLGHIAVDEGNLAAAILSFATGLIADPENKYAGASVTMLNSIAKMNDDVAKKASARKPSLTDDFEMINEIISSKVALDPQYKLHAGLEDPIVRQLQVVLEKLSYTKADKGFWNQYYVPFYEQLFKQGLFEPFVYYIFSGLDIKDVKTYVKKNDKKINAFIPTATEYFNEIRQTQLLDPEARKKQDLKYLFVNSKLTGRGKIVGEGDKAVGVGLWELYFENGTLRSKGELDEKQQKKGVWEFYHANGKLKERTTYVNDKPEGRSNSWYDNGKKAGEDTYKDGELDGLSVEYFYNGLLRKTEHYKVGKKEGSTVGYNNNGTKNYVTEYKNDLEEGVATYYHKNGKILSTSNYKNDEPEGAFKSYYLNGTLKLEGSFAAGKRVGVWKDYYNSGQLKSTSNYTAGDMDGEFVAYYWNGKPMIRSLYLKDKLEGKYEDFDSDGKLYSDSYYEKGRLKELKFYNKDGKEISNANIRNGAGNLVYYDEMGNKTSEGYFTKEGLRNGKTTWYYDDGKISAVANYKEGLFDGEKINYYKNGAVSSKINFKDDEQNGYKVLYYIDGVKQYEGMMVDGDNDGLHIQYDEFGSVLSKTNYRDGEVEGFTEYYHPNGKIDMEQYYSSGWLSEVNQFDTLGKPFYELDLRSGEGAYELKKYTGKKHVQGNYKGHYLHGQHKILFDGTNPSAIYHYKYGIIDSAIKQYYYNGKVQSEGQYKMGEKDGKWNYNYDNSKLYYTETYDNGRLNGTTKLFNEDGHLDKEITYDEGEMHGEYKVYGDNDQLALVCNYEQGRLVSYTYEGKDGKLVPAIPVKNGTANVVGYYKNGTKSAELNFNQDETNGARKLYFTNGKTYVDGTRVFGYDHGMKKVYLQDGTLSKEETYHYDKLHGSVKKYFANGKLQADESWYNGDLHGDSKYYDNSGKLIETRNYYYGSLQLVKNNQAKMNFNKRFALCLATILSVNYLQAQSVDEVLQKFPNDHAVILNLNRDTRIYFKDNQPVAESYEETDILVLNDKANGIYNKYKVFHGSFDELRDLNAYTNVPDGNKYRKIKVVDIKTQNATSSGVFYDDMKESVFDFPSMVKGAIATETHTEYHKDPHLLSPFYFTSYMPIVNSKFTVSFPAGMQVKYIIKNDDDKTIQVKEEKRGKQTVYTFSALNQKSRDRYGDGPSRSYYEPHVIIHLASYKNDNGEQVNYLGSVDDLFKWNYGFLKEVNTLSSPLLQHLSDSLTAGIKSDKEKARQIYKWVQDNIKYVAFEEGVEGFRPRQAADVCTKRYGDCKDMASLLTALLKLANVKAYFTWIGTRDIPYNYNDVPLPITDNHMISTVNIGDEWIFLDGTDPNCIFGSPSKAIQGKQALVGLNEKEYKIIKVPELGADKNYMIDSTFISLSDNGIKGKSSVYYNGYFGVDIFNTLLYKGNKDLKDYVKARTTKGSNKYILDDYSVNHFNKADRIMNIKTSFEVPDYGKKIADEVYINMALDRYSSTAIIDTVKRKIPVDNDFKFHVKNYTILEVPIGYEVSYMPENYKFKNSLFAFDVKYSQSAGKIIAEQEFKSDIMMLEPKDFNKWNETIKELNIQRKKQLVLKKK